MPDANRIDLPAATGRARHVRELYHQLEERCIVVYAWTPQELMQGYHYGAGERRPSLALSRICFAGPLGYLCGSAGKGTGR
jgi:hypothetical protein